MEDHIGRLIAACGLRHFAYRQWDAPEVILPKGEGPEAPGPETAGPEATLPTVAAALPVAVEGAAPGLPVRTVEQAGPLALPQLVLPQPAPAEPLRRPPLTLPAPHPEAPPADSVPRFRLPGRHGFLPGGDRRLRDVGPSAPRGPAAHPPGRPPVRLPAPEEFDAAQGSAATGVDHSAPPSPSRRFALLDEIAPHPAAPLRGPQDRRRPAASPFP